MTDTLGGQGASLAALLARHTPAVTDYEMRCACGEDVRGPIAWAHHVSLALEAEGVRVGPAPTTEYVLPDGTRTADLTVAEAAAAQFRSERGVGPADAPPEPTDDEIEAARVAWERFGTALSESGLRAKIVDVLRAAFAVRVRRALGEGEK